MVPYITIPQSLMKRTLYRSRCFINVYVFLVEAFNFGLNIKIPPREHITWGNVTHCVRTYQYWIVWFYFRTLKTYKLVFIERLSANIQLQIKLHNQFLMQSIISWMLQFVLRLGHISYIYICFEMWFDIQVKPPTLATW